MLFSLIYKCLYVIKTYQFSLPLFNHSITFLLLNSSFSLTRQVFLKHRKDGFSRNKMEIS